MTLLEAVQHQFDTARNAQLFKDSEQVISHDSGSSMLGFATALLGLAFCRETGPAKSALTLILFSVLVAALPLIDAGVAILRRTRQRASPLYGDRRHFYDLLLARGVHGAPGSSGLLRDNGRPCDRGMVHHTVRASGGAHLKRSDRLRVNSNRSADGRDAFARRPNKRRTQQDLQWRKMADRALHEKV